MRLAFATREQARPHDINTLKANVKKPSFHLGLRSEIEITAGGHGAYGRDSNEMLGAGIMAGRGKGKHEVLVNGAKSISRACGADCGS